MCIFRRCKTDIDNAIVVWLMNQVIFQNNEWWCQKLLFFFKIKKFFTSFCISNYDGNNKIKITLDLRVSFRLFQYSERFPNKNKTTKNHPLCKRCFCNYWKQLFSFLYYRWSILTSNLINPSITILLNSFAFL